MWVLGMGLIVGESLYGVVFAGFLAVIAGLYRRTQTVSSREVVKE